MIGFAIVIIGTIVTLWTMIFAIRTSFQPGEADPEHPKYSILRPDR